MCNLRSLLVYTEYEQPIEGLQDVLNRQQRVWMPRDMSAIWPENKVVDLGELEEVWKKVAALSKKTGGAYSLANTKGSVPERAVKDVLKNGASYLSHEVMTNTQRPFAFELIGMKQSKFTFMTIPFGFVFKRYTPWSEMIKKKSEEMTQAGIYVKIVYDYNTIPIDNVIEFLL